MTVHLLAAAVFACTLNVPGEGGAPFRLLVAPDTVTMFGAGGRRNVFQRTHEIEDGGAIVGTQRQPGRPTASIVAEADGSFQLTFLDNGDVAMFAGRCRRAR